jgi:sperm-associated antigen 16 protein
MTDLNMCLFFGLFWCFREEKEAEKQEDASTATLDRRHEAVDDFIRNFLVRNGFEKTLEQFQTEWYEAIESGRIDAQKLASVPDVYFRNQQLEQEIVSMQEDLSKAKDTARNAKSTWDKFRKERDFHRMHHRRVLQEKEKLAIDIRRLKKHYEHYEPAIQEIKRKYEVSMKEKMLVRIEKDKLESRVKGLEESIRQLEAGKKGTAGAGGEGIDDDSLSGSKKKVPAMSYPHSLHHVRDFTMNE